VAAATAAKPNVNMQTLLVAALVIAAFFGAYRFARASNSPSGAAPIGLAGAAAPAAGGGALTSPSSGGAAGAAAGGGGCCGGGGPAVAGAAKVDGGVQKIAVDLSSGSYNPNTINLKAGVPTEITFGQASGCTSVVQSADLGFSEDLSAGPKTVKIAALKPGTYGFACGMNMVQGTIVVK
jgi:plastocyanin